MSWQNRNNCSWKVYFSNGFHLEKFETRSIKNKDEIRFLLQEFLWKVEVKAGVVLIV